MIIFYFYLTYSYENEAYQLFCESLDDDEMMPERRKNKKDFDGFPSSFLAFTLSSLIRRKIFKKNFLKKSLVYAAICWKLKQISA